MFLSSFALEADVTHIVLPALVLSGLPFAAGALAVLPVLVALEALSVLVRSLLEGITIDGFCLRLP